MRTERIIHLLRGKWTQALKQFCGRRVSKCDHFVTCQEERELVLPGGHQGVGLSDATVSIHPFRFGEEGGGRGGFQLKPQGCRLPSEKATHPEARKICQHPAEISLQRYKTGQGPCEAKTADLFLLAICRTGGWGLLWGVRHLDSWPDQPFHHHMVGSAGGVWARPLHLGSLGLAQQSILGVSLFSQNELTP